MLSFLYYSNSLKCQPLTNTFPQINEKRISFCFACFDVQFSSGCPAVEDILPGRQKKNQVTNSLCHGLNHSSCCWIHWGSRQGYKKLVSVASRIPGKYMTIRQMKWKRTTKKWSRFDTLVEIMIKSYMTIIDKPTSSHGFDYKLVSLFSFDFEYCIVVLL